jgi:DNA helicase-2/ATP-dependent DNA helicase PcrA
MTKPHRKTDDFLDDVSDVWGAPAKIVPISTAFAEIIDGLNAQQAEAVSTLDGAVQVVAGAGTGKTRILTTRIGNLLHLGRAEPEEILAVTFTNKAAGEMRERIVAMIGEDGERVRMGSFHAIALGMLRQHPAQVGLENDRFAIIDDADQRSLVESIAKDLGRVSDDDRPSARDAKGRQERLRSFQDRMAGWKEEGWTPDDVRDRLADGRLDASNPDLVDTAELYAAYQEALLRRNACDFADLLLHMVVLFRKDPVIRSHWASKFRYVLVDEFQDTNPLQYEWLEHLARGHGNICVVGDLDQCIYQWRNARPEIFSSFSERWAGCRVITVDRNYRSTQQILDVANAVVEKNARLVEKRLNSPSSGPAPTFAQYQGHDDEAKDIAARIANLRSDGHPLSEIAILLRSAAPMLVFEKHLSIAKIPYVVVGGERFHEREEIKDALAYLRLALDPRDETAFMRIADKPMRGIGEATAVKVAKLFRKGGVKDFAVACDRVSKAPGSGTTQNARVALEGLGKLIEKISDDARNGVGPGEILLRTLERIAYISWRIQSGDEKSEEREEALKELCRDADRHSDVSTYLQEIALISDQDVDDDVDAVRISTIHASKGLEFDVVFTPCLEEGILPNARSMASPYGLEEERRIAHVAWSRARKSMHVSCASQRYYKTTTPSSFLSDTGFLPPAEERKAAAQKVAAAPIFRRRRY